MTTIQVRSTAGLVIWLGCSRGLAQEERGRAVPRFEDYKVSNLYNGIVRPPGFGDPGQYSGADLRCFGGDPSEYARASVNFAGHFVIESCTCGSGCHSLFMWDALNDRFYGIPAGAIDVGPFDAGGMSSLL